MGCCSAKWWASVNPRAALPNAGSPSVDGTEPTPTPGSRAILPRGRLLVTM